VVADATDCLLQARKRPSPGEVTTYEKEGGVSARMTQDPERETGVRPRAIVEAECNRVAAAAATVEREPEPKQPGDLVHRRANEAAPALTASRYRTQLRLLAYRSRTTSGGPSRENAPAADRPEPQDRDRTARKQPRRHNRRDQTPPPLTPPGCL
jgi:hypothetical protein